MALQITPIHKNLHTKVTLLGLEFEDLVVVLLAAIVMDFMSHFVSDKATMLGLPLNLFMIIAVPLLLVPLLILFKYGKPRGYLQDWAGSLLAPKAWCALERDAVLDRPYIIDSSE